MRIQDNKYIVAALIALISVSFIAMMTLQIVSLGKTAEVMEQQFANSVHRAIHRTSIDIEEEEVAQIIREIAGSSEPESEYARQMIGFEGSRPMQHSVFSHDSVRPVGSHSRSSGISAATSESISESSENLAANRDLMLAVMARKYASISSESIYKRVSPDFIRNALSHHLHDNGIDLGFRFAVRNNRNGQVQFRGERRFDIHDYRCYHYPTFSNGGKNTSFDMYIFFPKKRSMLQEQFHLMVPYVLASMLLLILCISTFSYLLHQRQLAQIQNDFVRNMTHELKTPVASISLAAQMLSDPSVQLSEASRLRMSSTIKDESARLVRLIDAVLQTSILEQNTSLPNPTPLDVNDIIQTARNGLLLKAASKGGEIRLLLDADDFIIEGDETHFTNIVFNLIENALKYSSPDRKPVIEVHTYNRDNRLFIEVSDNGIGIEQQYLSMIFDKYFRVPTGNEHSVKGFGLGLAYVRNMVLRHHGKIHVESQLGIGTRFTIDLPIYDG